MNKYKMVKRMINPRRKRIMKKRMFRKKVSLNKKIKVHYIKRSVYWKAYITASALGDVGGAQSFALSQLTQYQEFTNLFDEYRINAVKVRLYPRSNSTEQGLNNNQVRLFTAPDYDDVATPVLNDMLQYESLKSSNSTQVHTRYVVPKVASEVYQGVASTGYGAKRAWINCANTAVPHYGLKYIIQQLPAADATLIYDAHITYYMAFRGVR